MENSGSVVRAIRGPICLITIGVLFALNNFTRWRFDQTWPVLLIVFGLLSILRRGVEPPPVPRPPIPPVPPPPPPPRYTTTGYAQSSYSQPPPPPSGDAPVKGGFGGSAPPRAPDVSNPSSGTEGGTQ